MDIGQKTKRRSQGVQWDLMFNSGFGGTTRLVAAAGPYFHGSPEQYEDIVGADESIPKPNKWDDISRHPNLSDLRIYYEGGTNDQRSARIVTDESNPSRRILQFRLNEPNVTINWPDGPQHKARVQAELYGNTGLHEFYQTIRLRLHSDLELIREYPGKISWLPNWLPLILVLEVHVALHLLQNP